MASQKMTKNQMRRAKKKEQKKTKVEQGARETTEVTEGSPTDKAEELAKETEQPASELEVKKGDSEAPPADGPVPDSLDEFDEDPSFAQYKEIFEKFGVATAEDSGDARGNAKDKQEVYFNDDEIPSEDEETGQTRLSKKKRKQLNKLSIAELKALVQNPEVVEWQDVSSSDPRLLVQIKAQRNVVPVPPHWSLKREYLSSKRGIEKPPFRLPQFIAETGITEMRDAVLEKQAEQTLKQKQRERVAPKMGKLDIDYQRLYDAFFRFQTKPELTRFGEVYYEGKESEVDFRHFRPGDLTDATKEALGIPPGAPPPWLINQQRFGPPPSYPTLKIPGLNAPIPPGGQWGFHPGGWGKPPVDEFNRPLFGGDVFGSLGPTGAGAPAQAAQVVQAAQPQLPAGEPVEKTLWGELQPREEESEEEESEEESDEEENEELPGGGLETPSGLETPGGFVSSVPTDYPATGVETSVAGEMDLRKSRRGFDTEESSHPRAAYTVLQERTGRGDSGFFGSEKTYDINAARANMPVLGQEDDSRKRKKPGDVDVALDPDALTAQGGLSKDEVKRRFEEGRKEDGVGARWSYEDDLQDMIAQESRKRQKVDEKRQEKKRESKYRF